MIPKFIREEKCTGCGACKNICQKDCITMCEKGIRGDIYPDIDEEKCVQCGLCEKVCPVLIEKRKSKYLGKCYAAWADITTRHMSSSGGAFRILAEYVIDKGGMVCGALMDDNLQVYHNIVSKKEELILLQKSKYVQSDTKFVYREIEELLRKKKWVLFIGCPCQVAAIKTYLEVRKVDVSLLLTVNIFCYGVPSQKLFRQYIEEIFDERNVKSVDFRDKKTGWISTGMTVYTSDSEMILGIDRCEYEQAFHNNLIMRDSCYDCKFCESSYEGDISLGDFWGIERFRPDWNDNQGTSLIMVNSEKGEWILKECKNFFDRIEEMPLEYVANRTEAKKEIPMERLRLNELLHSKKFVDAVRSVLKKYYDIGIVGVWFFSNRGTEMTYLALYHVLKDMGYSVLLISQPENSIWKPTREHLNFLESPYKPYEMAEFYADKESMIALNEKCKMFVMGSDQWLKNDIYKMLGEFSTMEWVLNIRYKMIYSTSFGHDYLLGTEIENQMMGYYLKQMDAISVREESGSRLLKNNFGIDTPVVLDPVFLCDIKYYEELAEQGMDRIPNEKYLCAYILDPSAEKECFVNMIGKKLKLRKESFVDGHLSSEELEGKWNIECLFDVTNEEWMAHYKNADFIITDSFHGMCFAIIHQKQFLVLVNERRGKERFTSISQTLDLNDRLVYSPYTCDISVLNRPIDYDKVNHKLKEYREISYEWLKNCVREGMNKNEELNMESVLRYEHFQKNSLFQDELRVNNMHVRNLITCIGDINRHFVQQDESIRRIRPLYRKVLSKIKSRLKDRRMV